MAVVADTAELRIEPSLEEARALAAEGNVVPVRARFVDDCETPVSAFLKLRAGEPEGAPCFLLESAEQGQVGRYSFVGIRPRSVLRWSDGVLSETGGRGAGRAGSLRRRRREPRPLPARPGRGPAAVLPAARSASSATTWCARSSRSASPTPTRSGCPTWR